MKIKIPDVTLRRDAEQLYQEVTTQHFNTFQINHTNEVSEKLFTDMQDVLKSFVKHLRSSFQVMTEDERSQTIPMEVLPVNVELEHECEEMKHEMKIKSELLKNLRIECKSKLNTALENEYILLSKELPQWNSTVERLSTIKPNKTKEPIEIVSTANLESKIRTIIRNTKDLAETLPKSNKNFANLEQTFETLFDNDKIAQKQKQVQQVRNNKKQGSSSQSDTKTFSSQQLSQSLSQSLHESSSSQPSSSQESKGRKSVAKKRNAKDSALSPDPKRKRT